jgi:hypothetical protein
MKFVAGTDFFLLLHFAENFRALCAGILLPWIVFVFSSFNSLKLLIHVVLC